MIPAARRRDFCRILLVSSNEAEPVGRGGMHGVAG